MIMLPVRRLVKYFEDFALKRSVISHLEELMKIANYQRERTHRQQLL
jgi:hypothetical protein